LSFIIFDTPIIGPFARFLSRTLVNVLGWKAVDLREDKVERYVMALAPHTSNWDFFYIYIISQSLSIRGQWLGKHSLFKGPMGPIMRWMGGIPVVRTRSSNLVDQCIKAYNDDPRLMLAITPEGTRSRVDRWKTGFYNIAMGANVRIALAYLDYQKKEGGIGAMFTPTGNIDEDLPRIREFYREIVPKHPERFDPN